MSTQKDTNLYTKLVKSGAQIDSHCSDLYVLLTTESRKIIEESGCPYTTFVSNIGGKLWADIPFAFYPYWKKRSF